MSDVSGILLAVLAMAALLGALIGGSVMLLFGQRHARRLERQALEARSSSDRESAARLVVSQQTLERERLVHRDMVAALRAREQESVARQDSLQVHARTQARRIETLQGEQLASEERQMRLERALHAQREELGWTVRDRSGAGEWPGVDAVRAPADPERAGMPDVDALSGDDELHPEPELPMLRRRLAPSPPPAGASHPLRGSRSRLASGRLARGTGGASAHPSPVRPLDDGEFPALSETDLPDSVEGLELGGSGDLSP